MPPNLPAHLDATLDGVMRQVSAGDQGAFADLYDRTSPQVLGLIVHLVKDRQKAELLCMHTYLEVWRRARRFNPKLSPLSQILTIAHNHAAAHLAG